MAIKNILKELLIKDIILALDLTNEFTVIFDIFHFFASVNLINVYIL